MRLTILLLCGAAALPAALSQSEAEALFAEANQRFRQANQLSESDSAQAYDLYEGAALRYRRLADEAGRANSKLLYNLGNAYFQMGDIGRAILAYRRALEYEPGDPNLLQNLRYARSRRLDRFEETTESAVLKTLLFWHYDFSLGTRLAATAVFGAVFWGLMALRLFRRVPLAARAIFGVLTLALFLSVAVSAAGSPDAFGVVVAPETTGRRGDGESYEPAFESPLHAGAEFTLVEERPGWLHIELPDGRRAWIPASDAELAPR